MLLPHKPKQTYKFKTKNQPLLQRDQEDSWWREGEEVVTTWINQGRKALSHVIQHQLSPSGPYRMERPEDDTAHSKSRSAGIASDRDTRSKYQLVSLCGQTFQ